MFQLVHLHRTPFTETPRGRHFCIPSSANGPEGAADDVCVFFAVNIEIVSSKEGRANPPTLRNEL